MQSWIGIWPKVKDRYKRKIDVLSFILPLTAHLPAWVQVMTVPVMVWVWKTLQRDSCWKLSPQLVEPIIERWLDHDDSNLINLLTFFNDLFYLLLGNFIHVYIQCISIIFTHIHITFSYLLPISSGHHHPPTPAPPPLFFPKGLFPIFMLCCFFNDSLISIRVASMSIGMGLFPGAWATHQ